MTYYLFWRDMQKKDVRSLPDLSPVEMFIERTKEKMTATESNSKRIVDNKRRDESYTEEKKRFVHQNRLAASILRYLRSETSIAIIDSNGRPVDVCHSGQSDIRSPGDDNDRQNTVH